MQYHPMQLTRRTFAPLLAAPFLLRAQASQTRVYLDPRRSIASLDRNVFGSFLEHLGRAIYGGVYEPGSKLADAQGFRKDVAEEIKGMRVPIVRYPGGNFVSGYNWLDGVGPKNKRPVVLERAWNSIETNQFGTNEFIDWCKLVGTEPLLGLNLGTGTPESAANLVEYCNATSPTKFANMRKEHGYAAPHNVKYWCIGNEMDGPWQIGHMPAEQFARVTADTARQMRNVDRGLKLIACGSSSASMPQYAEWDRIVLEACYNLVDGISLHRYWGNQYDGGKTDTARFLAENIGMERQIEGIVATADYVGAKLKTGKKLFLSFDEWNVWYRARGGNGERKEAPKLLEEIYNLEDALLVGGAVNSLIRKSDRVKVACLAQLVNVIGPIMTSPEGYYRQTIYYPYQWALAHASGEALDLGVFGPTYDTRVNNQPTKVGMVDVASTLNGNEGALFLLNRDLEKPQQVEVMIREGSVTPTAWSVLTGNDLKATNEKDPNAVKPATGDLPKAGSKLSLTLAPRSYNMIRYRWQG